MRERQWWRWCEDTGSDGISCNTPVVLHWTYAQHHLSTETNTDQRGFKIIDISLEEIINTSEV